MARRKLKDNTSLVCHKTRQYKDIYSCALNCRDKCDGYFEMVTLERLEEFVEKHPEYVITGELMAKPTPNEKKFWIVDNNNLIQEVTEKEILENPKEYLDKQIWDRPPSKYEVIISLKRVKA